MAITDAAGRRGVAGASVAAAGVAHVLAGHPAAVLLVDLSNRQVTYANPLAVQLAPGVRLPVDVDEWSRSAGLRDADGDEMADTATPLRRVAAGEPVNGEEVSARRGSDISAARERMWVLGTPMLDAPAPLGGLALVLLLPLRDRGRVSAAQQASALAHRAVVSSEVSFVISDPNAPDNPLVWVNPAFERITGYTAQASVGRNCRFLQGPATDRLAVQRIGDGLAAGGIVTETVLNYRADGTAFWNQVVVSPIYDADGRLTHHVGVQTDVTERVEADAERDQALRTAQAALAESERANDRLSTLAEASLALAASLDGDADVLAGLVEAIAPRSDGWVVAATLTEQGGVDRVVAAGAGPGEGTRTGAELARAANEWARGPGKELLVPLMEHLTGSARAAALTVDVQDLALLPLPDAIRSQLPSSGTVAVAATGLFARGSALGLLAQVRIGAGFDEHDTDMLTDLGARAGVVLDNRRLFAREHTAAVTLQRSLLPKDLPQPVGFEAAAVYRPADSHAEAGGDWYDLILPVAGDGGGFIATVGDVMGHDLSAAAVMGQLRSVLRSQALSGAAAVDALDALDTFADGARPIVLATCAYLAIRPGPDGGYVAETMSAGHPPPLLRTRDGAVTALRAGLRPPIGVGGFNTPPEISALPSGSSIVLYTDGLIERRGIDLQTGIDALAGVLAAADPGFTAEQLCAHIVAAMISDQRDDDTCVLVLHRL
ncbi:MAG: putative sensor protein [Pseudonocardiales bacterium]|nr:putative sensor protein [Pseudonocardiales bacterium]